jgi:hypothetical protein
MTNPNVFKPSKVYAWVQVAQINDTGDITSDTAATTMTVDSGHRLIVGMDVLIESEAVKVTAINTSTHAITIDRAEVTDTSATTTTAATHANDTAIYAWSELTGSNEQALTQQLNIVDRMYKPRMCHFIFANPFLTDNTSLGELDGIIKRGTSIRVVEGENYSILFTGKIQSLTKMQALQEGNTLHVTAIDHLQELAKTKIAGEHSTVNLTNASGGNGDLGSDRTRSALIKYLVKRFQLGGHTGVTDGDEINLTTTEPVSGSAKRFCDSSTNIATITRQQKVTFNSSDTTVLYGIKRIALADPVVHSVITKLGWIFNADPNVTSFSTASNPAQFFSYYRSGSMPATVFDGATSFTPGNSELIVRNYGATAQDNNGSERIMKPGAAFDHLQQEQINEVAVRYRDPITNNMTEQIFELFHWKSQTDNEAGIASQDRYSGKALMSGSYDTNGTFGAEDPDRRSTSDASSWKSRVVDASNNIIGYVQYMSATSGTASGGTGIMVLSGTSQGSQDGTVAAGETLYFDKYVDGSSEDTVVLSDNTDPEENYQYRPSAVRGERNIARLDLGNVNSYNDIRQAVVSRFAQRSIPKIRGRFQIDGKYLHQSLDIRPVAGDTIATSSVGTKTKTVWTDASGGGALASHDSGSLATLFSGFGARAGSTINKLTGDGGTADTYGYIEKVENFILTFMMNSGTIAADDYLRINVPMRAGYNLQQQSITHNIGTGGSYVGGGALITSLSYMETGGRAYTDVETLAHNSATTQDIICQDKVDVGDLDEQFDDDYRGPYGFDHGLKVHYTGGFMPGDAAGSLANANKNISWSAGSLFIGGKTYEITADDTADSTYGTGDHLPTADDDSDGQPDTRVIIFFEPDLSETKFYAKTETEYELRNSSESRPNTIVGNLRLPTGQNRIKLATCYASTDANGKAVYELESGFSTGGANTTPISGSADTSRHENHIHGPNSFQGVINQHWFPLADNSFDLGTASKAWKDINYEGSITDTSDARVKDNIEPLQLGLDFINDLEPVQYNKQSNPSKLDVGVTAQDVLEAMEKFGLDPEEGTIVHEINTENKMRLNYLKLIAPMMKAIQELSDEVDKLKNEGEE